MLDVFSTNEGFKSARLTAAINLIPFTPSQLGDLGLFEEHPINTTSAQVEYNQGLLSLLQTKPRGGDWNQGSNEKRSLRSFVVPHIPYEEQIFPSDVQDVRDFGSEQGLQTIASRVTQKLEVMSRKHDFTHEHLRVGAIKGVILDADGEEIYDLFDEFGISQTEVTIDLSDDDTDVKSECLDIVEAVEAGLGGVGYSRIRAFGGSGLWKALIEHESVKQAYANSQANAFLRQDPTQMFEFGGITWERYKQTGNSWIPTNDARIVVEGVPDLYKGFVAPADLIDTVNTFGQLKVVRQEPMKYGKGVGLYSESNYLPMCTRPQVCIRLTTPASS